MTEKHLKILFIFLLCSILNLNASRIPPRYIGVDECVGAFTPAFSFRDCFARKLRGVVNGSTLTPYQVRGKGLKNFWVDFKRTINEIDNKIFLSINQSVKSKLVDYIMIVLTMLGNGLIVVPLVGLILFLNNRVTFKSDFIIFIVVLLCGGIVIQILKFLFDKARPLKSLQDLIAANQIHVKVLLGPLKEKGFPSGHTQSVFAAAVFLSKKIKKFAWLFFIVAFLSGISRIYVGAHYFSDVIGGMIIGIVVTEFFYRIIEKRRKTGTEETTIVIQTTK